MSERRDAAAMPGPSAATEARGNAVREGITTRRRPEHAEKTL
jgi:hypothetical protein